MMERKEEAKKWLEFAEEDLKASAEMERLGFRRIATNLLQQSAEKSLKGVIIFLGLENKLKRLKTHNIGQLVDVLIESGIYLDENIIKSVSLTRYAFTTRYPDDYVPVSKEEYEEAYEIALKVYEWAKGIIEGSALE